MRANITRFTISGNFLSFNSTEYLPKYLLTQNDLRINVSRYIGYKTENVQSNQEKSHKGKFPPLSPSEGKVFPVLGRRIEKPATGGMNHPVTGIYLFLQQSCGNGSGCAAETISAGPLPPEVSPQWGPCTGPGVSSARRAARGSLPRSPAGRRGCASR